MAVGAQPTGDVCTTLNYYITPPRGGSDSFHPGTVGATRCEHGPVETLIGNIRGCQADFELDKHGFEVLNSISAEKEFDDEEEAVAEGYDEECRQLIKNSTSATRVVQMARLVRRRDSAQALKEDEVLEVARPR